MNNYIYIRYSSDLQSADHQINSCINYCKQNKLEIQEENIIKDEGISAYRKTIEARDGILYILDKAQNGEISNLIIFESSRLSRKYYESINLFGKLTQFGVLIHSVSDNKIINKEEIDTLMVAFKSYMNQQASIETGKRVKSAQAILKAEGKHAAGGIPWGFEIKEGYLVPMENMKNEVIELFNDYIVHGTKFCMNKYKIKNRSTLLVKIKNEKYIEIVGEAIFNRANEVRKNRLCCKKNNEAKCLNRSNNVLFEGLLFHKNCNKKLYIYRDNRTSEHKHYWRCSTCRGNENITSKKSFSNVLDRNIEDELLQVLDNLDHEKLEQKYNLRSKKKEIVLELGIKNIEVEIAEKNRTIEKANKRLSQYIMDDAKDELINNISELITENKTKIKALQEELLKKQNEFQLLMNKEMQQESLIKNLLNAKEIYKNATIEQKKAIIQIIVKRIEVRDINDFDIFLNI